MIKNVVTGDASHKCNNVYMIVHITFCFTQPVINTKMSKYVISTRLVITHNSIHEICLRFGQHGLGIGSIRYNNI